jgi:hypothetical protein
LERREVPREKTIERRLVAKLGAADELERGVEARPVRATRLGALLVFGHRERALAAENGVARRSIFGSGDSCGS